MLEPRTDFRQLSPEQWERSRQEIIQRANEARARVVRDLVRGLFRSMAESGRDLARSVTFQALTMAGRWIRGYANWLKRRQAVRALAALDDCALKDIGIHRSEIEAVVDGRDLKRKSECEVSAPLSHQRCHRPITRAKFPTKQPIRKNAA